MAKSSINFAKATSGGLRHNDRTEVPDYLLPEEFRLNNECDLSAHEADKKMMSLYAEAKENYQETTGQKLQATSYKWEAVINLNKEHTLEDVQRLSKELEKETGFTSIQIAIHNDEGRVEKDKQGQDFAIYNHHAHITFFTLDRKSGINLYRKDITKSQRKEIEKDIFSNHKDIEKGEAGSEERKSFNKLVNAEIKNRDFKVMDTKRLSQIQTMTAKSLGMVRGKVSVKEEAEKLGVEQDLDPTQRLEHKPYKKVSQELSGILAKQKDLKAEIKELRADLKAQGAGREQYAELERLNKDLKERIKSKDLTIADLKNELEAKISPTYIQNHTQTPKTRSKRELDALNAIYSSGGDAPLVKEYPSTYPTAEETYPKTLPTTEEKYPTQAPSAFDIAKAKAILSVDIKTLEQSNSKLKNHNQVLGNDITNTREQTKNALLKHMNLEDAYEELEEEHTNLKKAYDHLKELYVQLKEKYKELINYFEKKEDNNELHIRNR